MSITDASDPKAIQASIKEAKSKDDRAKEGLHSLMRDVNGRAWLYRVLMFCDPYRSPFSTDALVMAKNCGEANIGLQIIADMQECSPELYLQTMKENNG
jgi:hypothetical protein